MIVVTMSPEGTYDSDDYLTQQVRRPLQAWYPTDGRGQAGEIARYRLCRRRCQGVGRGALREPAGEALYLDAWRLRFEGPRVPITLRAGGDFAPVRRQGIRPRQRLGFPVLGTRRPQFRGAGCGHERNAPTGTARSDAEAEDSSRVGRHARPGDVRNRRSLRGGSVYGRHAS